MTSRNGPRRMGNKLPDCTHGYGRHPSDGCVREHRAGVTADDARPRFCDAIMNLDLILFGEHAALVLAFFAFCASMALPRMERHP